MNTILKIRLQGVCHICLIFKLKNWFLSIFLVYLGSPVLYFIATEQYCRPLESVISQMSYQITDELVKHSRACGHSGILYFKRVERQTFFLPPETSFLHPPYPPKSLGPAKVLTSQSLQQRVKFCRRKAQQIKDLCSTNICSSTPAKVKVCYMLPAWSNRERPSGSLLSW